MLLSTDLAAQDRLGYSLSISGGTALACAQRHDNNGFDSGAAYLFDAAGTPTCPADIDDSGDVDLEDLLLVLEAWGNKGGPEDLDGSGFVDIGDILAVLAAWGPCE